MSDFTKRFSWCILLISFSVSVYSQDYQALIRQHLESGKAGLKFDPADINDLSITDSYEDVSTGLHYVYAQQRNNGVPIENAVINFVFKQQLIVLANSDRLVSQVMNKINQSQPITEVSEAVITAITRSTGPNPLRSAPVLIESSLGHSYKFKKPAAVLEDIPAQLLYKLNSQNQLIL